MPGGASPTSSLAWPTARRRRLHRPRTRPLRRPHRLHHPRSRSPHHSLRRRWREKRHRKEQVSPRLSPQEPRRHRPQSRPPSASRWAQPMPHGWPRFARNRCSSHVLRWSILRRECQAITTSTQTPPCRATSPKTTNGNPKDRSALLEATMKAAGHTADFYSYPNQTLVLREQPPRIRPRSRQLAWERTLTFLREHLS